LGDRVVDGANVTFFFGLLFLGSRHRLATMSTTTISVTGMSCDHCVNSVTAELTKIAGVESVDVALTEGLVTVTSAGPLDEAAVAEAIDEAGFELGA
jgi:copper chaperone